jgi:hypothetical protein
MLIFYCFFLSVSENNATTPTIKFLYSFCKGLLFAMDGFYASKKRLKIKKGLSIYNELFI